MKISKLAIAALFAAGFITTGATASMAADTPYGLLDCPAGYSAVYSEDGFSGSCEPDADIYTTNLNEIVIDCKEGYTAEYSEDGFSGSCEPDADIYTTNLNEVVIDCKEGYTAEYSEDGTSGSCVPLSDIEIKPITSCWETEDGVNVCARGLMGPVKTDVEVTPYDAPPIVCASPEGPTVEDVPVCKEAVLYDSTDTSGEEPMPIDDDGMVDDPTLMYQSGIPMAASSTEGSSSNTLAAFGVLVAALGALGIGISKQRASTK
jgi:hypothetical protein